jgi:hypothetical protein
MTDKIKKGETSDGTIRSIFPCKNNRIRLRSGHGFQPDERQFA